MNAGAAAVVGAVTFVWLGMVVAISFLEAPLKFRAPGVTVPLGLAVGRLVFRALNLVEAVLAVVVITVVTAVRRPPAVAVLTAFVAILLVVQFGLVRPRLNRRIERVLAGQNLPPSRVHLCYVALEIAKVIALLGLGAGVLLSRHPPA